MKKLLSANFSRLFHSKIYWLGMIFMFGFAAFAVASRFRDKLVAPDYAYPTADGLWFVGGMYFAIVLAVFISIWVGTDYSDGTIRNKLSVGHTRAEIYSSNWIVCTVASLMMHVIYILTVWGAGYLLLGKFETPTKTLVLCTLASLVTVIAMSSLFLLLAMLIHNKATGAVVSMILALVLLFGAMTVMQMLSAPELVGGFTVSVNGEMRYIERQPNPDYLSGIKREIFQFILDFQPGGQMIQYGMSESLPTNFARFPIYSLLFVFITVAGGWGFFRRKDLK